EIALMSAPFPSLSRHLKRFSLTPGSCLLALLAFPVQADDLIQIFELAQQHDPRLAEARERYEAEHTLLDQSRANFLPRLTLSGSSSRLAQAPTETFSHSQGFNAHSYSLNL